MGVPYFQQRDSAQLSQRDRSCFSAGPLNLLPPPLVNAKPPGHRLAGNTNPLQLAPPGVQHPPAGRNLDQAAPVPQEVEPLAVGVAG